MEEFKGAPAAAEKEAEAAKVLAQPQDNLLRNLKVKAQTRTVMFPEGCEVSDAGVTRRWVAPHNLAKMTSVQAASQLRWPA